MEGELPFPFSGNELMSFIMTLLDGEALWTSCIFTPTPTTRSHSASSELAFILSPLPSPAASEVLMDSLAL